MSYLNKQGYNPLLFFSCSKIHLSQHSLKLQYILFHFWKAFSFILFCSFSYCRGKSTVTSLYLIMIKWWFSIAQILRKSYPGTFCAFFLEDESDLREKEVVEHPFSLKRKTSREKINQEGRRAKETHAVFQEAWENEI